MHGRDLTSVFFRKVEFFLNTMFFLIFPFAICCHRLKKLFRPDRRRCYSNQSKVRVLSSFVLLYVCTSNTIRCRALEIPDATSSRLLRHAFRAFSSRSVWRPTRAKIRERSVWILMAIIAIRKWKPRISSTWWTNWRSLRNRYVIIVEVR